MPDDGQLAQPDLHHIANAASSQSARRAAWRSTTSRWPGSNQRPSTSRTCGRRAKALGDTPRSVTLASPSRSPPRGEVEDDHRVRGNERAVRRVARDLGRILDHVELLARNLAAGFRRRTAPHDHEIARVASARARFFQAHRQRLHADIDGHDQRHAEHRRQRRAPADDDVADVVAEGQSHGAEADDEWPKAEDESFARRMKHLHSGSVVKVTHVLFLWLIAIATAPAESPDTVALRRSLSASRGKPDVTVLDFAWPYLDSPDSSIREAARKAVEAQPFETWKQRALDEKRTWASLEVLAALCHVCPRAQAADLAPHLCEQITTLQIEHMDEEQFLAALRLTRLVLTQLGPPTEDERQQMLDLWSRFSPAKGKRSKAELGQLLAFLTAKTAR